MLQRLTEEHVKQNVVHSLRDNQHPGSSYSFHSINLLQIFNDVAGLSSLPRTTKTLLKSNGVLHNFIDMPPGKYYHHGVAVPIRRMLHAFEEQSLPISDELVILFNVDGIPLTKSIASEFWPVLCKVIGKNTVTVLYVTRNFCHV